MDSESFKKLEAEWDKKLAESGFVDVEPKNAHGERVLTHHDWSQYSEETAEYYRLAEPYLHKLQSDPRPRTPKRAKDLKIWALHAKGASLTEISRELKIPLTTVHRRVTALAAAMLAQARGQS